MCAPSRNVAKLRTSNKNERQPIGWRSFRPFPTALQQGLGQVVPERGEEHVLRRVRTATHARPNVAINIGVLRPPLQSAFRSFVEAIPEPDRTLHDDPCISVAILESARVISAGERSSERSPNRNAAGTGFASGRGRRSNNGG